MLPIWEGTTNILSLDVVRAITKTKGMVINAFCDIVIKKISNAHDQSHGNLSGICNIVEKKLRKTMEFLQEAAGKRPEYLEIAARDLAYSLARVYAGEQDVYVIRTIHFESTQSSSSTIFACANISCLHLF